MAATTRNPILFSVIFIAIVLGGGLLIGTQSMPDEWFAALVKPSFQPPNWLFGPVWTILYILIGIAGARIFIRDPGSTAMKLWFVQVILNFLWSPAFFVMHQLAVALAIVLALLVTILLFIRAAWPMDRAAAWLFVPYALWVAFASALNADILALN